MTSTFDAGTITGDTRPAVHDDLPDYVRAGRTFATVNGEMLVKYPEIGAHLLAALSDARKDKRLRVTAEGEIVEDLTDAELDAKLRRHQESWDHNRDGYLAARAGEPVVKWRRGLIDDWATKENLPAIDWTAVPE